MTSTVFLSIVGVGFVVAFLHAAIPTHWLPFALTARGQGWGLPRTLAVTMLAGVGHGLFTTLLGAVLVLVGPRLIEWTGTPFKVIAGGALILFGLVYLVRQVRGGGGGHIHLWHGPGHEHAHSHGHAHGTLGEAIGESLGQAATGRRQRSDGAAIASLMALLTFSPCESFLPVFLSGARYGWTGFAVLSVTLLVAVMIGMALFTTLSLAGLSRLRLTALERYEAAILGAMLCLLGVAVLVFET
ncbi:MAG TPA: hypothetical protein VG939_12335 [Caulobacteraceae bacterium]|nr:hypothetical protein [Caulobacteraceae bacterium]